MRSALEIRSSSPRQTVELGRRIGESLNGGEVIELCGPLGAGKTQLAKGLALGLGVPEDEPVVSPTFVLVREYQGRLKLYHCDAYRVQSAEELLALGLEEILEDPSTVIAIEWADRFPNLLEAATIRVRLEYEAESSRRLRISTPGAADMTQLAELAAATGLDRAGSE